MHRLIFVLPLLASCLVMEDSQSGNCRDGWDNDNDGRTDCDDPNCQDRPACRWGWYEPDTFFNRPDTDPPDDPYLGPWEITGAQWTCSAGTGDWNYRIETAGWAWDMVIDIQETGSTTPRSETHQQVNMDFAQDGSWDVWGSTLSHVDTAGQVVDGASTSFTCGQDDADNLAWMASMYDANGVTDCVLWGFEAEAYFNTQQGFSCIVMQ